MSCNPFKAWAHLLKNMSHTTCIFPKQVLYRPIFWSLQQGCQEIQCDCAKRKLGLRSLEDAGFERDYGGLKMILKHRRLLKVYRSSTFLHFVTWAGCHASAQNHSNTTMHSPSVFSVTPCCVAKLRVCTPNAPIRNDLKVDNKDTSNGLLVNLTA